MTTYTYTIYDADSDHHAAPGGAWPAHDGLTIRARSVESAVRRIRAIMRREGCSCGQYTSADTLVAYLWDENDVIVASPVETRFSSRPPEDDET